MSKPVDELKNRLREALAFRNMTQQELSDRTGIPKASISQYLSGYASPKQDRISLIATALEVDPVWLIGYDVSPSVSTLPIYEAAAGEGRVGDGAPTDEYHPGLMDDEIYVKVIGRSMEPTLLDGDIVVVSATSVLDFPRQIALVKVNGDEATIKRVEEKADGLLLLGDNIDVYPPHFYTAEEVQELPVTIEGVVTRLIRDVK